MASLTSYKNLQIVTPEPLAGSAGQALNDNFRALADRMFYSTPFVVVQSRTASTPPGSPADGATYIVGAGAGGAWAGQSGKIAIYYSGAWAFVTPVTGMHAKVLDTGDLVAYSVSVWVAYIFGGANALTAYRFRILYTGTNPTSVDLTEVLPSGWLAAFSGTNVTITHNVGKMPAFLTFLGVNGSTNALRYPTAVNQLTVAAGEEATKFTFAAGTPVTGAASGASALVIVQF